MHQTAPAGGVRETVVRTGRHLGEHETATLGGFTVVVAAVLGFLAVADAVVDGSTRSLDERLVLAFRRPDDRADLVGPDWVGEVARDVTALGGVAVLLGLTLTATAYLWLTRRTRTLLLLLLSVGGGLAWSSVLKGAFDRPRPDLVPAGSHVVTESFPSGHSMMAAVVYLTVAALLARAHSDRGVRAFLLVTAMVLSALVGVSRVMMGVHFPTDVLAGLLLGTAWAVLCLSLARRLQRRGSLEPPQGTAEDAPPPTAAAPAPAPLPRTAGPGGRASLPR